MKTIILATHNLDKLKEIEEIFQSLPVKLKSLLYFPEIPEVVEDGNTLEENALKKAREIFRATNIPALADDTGLEVFCLSMAPGVFSARYAGEQASYLENNLKLLEELKGVPANNRGARFRTIAAFVGDNFEKITEGVCYGRISENMSGTKGFGYDPLFIPDGYNISYAEMPLSQKNKISHRGEAFRLMIKFIKEYLTNQIK